MIKADDLRGLETIGSLAYNTNTRNELRMVTTCGENTEYEVLHYGLSGEELIVRTPTLQEAVDKYNTTVAEDKSDQDAFADEIASAIVGRVANIDVFNDGTIRIFAELDSGIITHYGVQIGGSTGIDTFDTLDEAIRFVAVA